MIKYLEQEIHFLYLLYHFDLFISPALQSTTCQVLGKAFTLVSQIPHLQNQSIIK